MTPLCSKFSRTARSRCPAASRRAWSSAARSRFTTMPPIMVMRIASDCTARSASSYCDFMATASRIHSRTCGSMRSASHSVKRLDMSGHRFRVMRGHVLVQHPDELGYDVVALERGHQASVHEDRRLGFFESARQRYAQIGVLGFARPVHYATHHGHLHALHARMFRLPERHLLAQVGLNLIGHLLEKGAGGAAASGTCGHLRREAANAQRLQDLLRDRSEEHTSEL